MASNLTKEYNSAYNCPKCEKIFHNPIILNTCGHTMCLKCIEKCLDGTNVIMCPICKVVCFEKLLTINHTLKQIIEEARQSKTISEDADVNKTEQSYVTGIYLNVIETKPKEQQIIPIAERLDAEMKLFKEKEAKKLLENISNKDAALSIDTKTIDNMLNEKFNARFQFETDLPAPQKLLKQKNKKIRLLNSHLKFDQFDYVQHRDSKTNFQD